MDAASNSITLLAMAPSGELLLARDAAGRTWLVQPPGSGGPTAVAPELVERAVAGHGFDRIDRQFANWPEVEAFRQEHASQMTPAVIVDRDALDTEDVRRLVEAGVRWVMDGAGPRALRLARELLGVPAVRRDPDALAAVAALMERLQQPAMALVPEPPTPLARAGRERWRAVRTPTAA